MKNSWLLIVMIGTNVLLLTKIFVFSPKYNGVGKQQTFNLPEPIKHSLVHSNLTNGREIPNPKLANLKNEDIFLHNFLKNQRALVLIYSEVDCNSCIDDLFSHFNYLASDRIAGARIVGIAHSSSLTYLRRFVRINETHFPFLWDSEDQLRQSLKLHSTPAVFMIDNLRVINSFFPVAGFPDLTTELSNTFFDIAKTFLNEKK